MLWQIVQGCSLSLLQSFVSFWNISHMLDKLDPQRHEKARHRNAGTGLLLKKVGGNNAAGGIQHPPTPGSVCGTVRSLGAQRGSWWVAMLTPSNTDERRLSLRSVFISLCPFESPEDISAKRTKVQRKWPVCCQRWWWGWGTTLIMT